MVPGGRRSYRRFMAPLYPNLHPAITPSGKTRPIRKIYPRRRRYPCGAIRVFLTNNLSLSYGRSGHPPNYFGGAYRLTDHTSNDTSIRLILPVLPHSRGFFNDRYSGSPIIVRYIHIRIMFRTPLKLKRRFAYVRDCYAA